MDRLIILVGRLKKSMGPPKYFFKVHLVGRFVPLVGVISRPVESPLQSSIHRYLQVCITCRLIFLRWWLISLIFVASWNRPFLFLRLPPAIGIAHCLYLRRHTPTPQHPNPYDPHPLRPTTPTTHTTPCSLNQLSLYSGIGMTLRGV